MKPNERDAELIGYMSAYRTPKVARIKSTRI